MRCVLGECSKMDAIEQGKYGMFRRDVRIAVSNESQQDRRIVRSIDEDSDDQFDDLEALRLAALRSLHSRQNSQVKARSLTTESRKTRHVSLGQEDTCDLKIITLERCSSFSSSSTDYEEIDLSSASDKEEHDKSENVFIDDKDSDDDDDYDEVNDDNDDDDDDDDDDGKSAKSIAYQESNEPEGPDSCSEEVNMEEYVSDKEDFNVDQKEEGSHHSSDVFEKELSDSESEVNILNDISITICNETMSADEEQQCVEIDDKRDFNAGIDTCEYESIEEGYNYGFDTGEQTVLTSSQNDDESEINLDNNGTSSGNVSDGRTQSQVSKDLISKSNLPYCEKIKPGLDPEGSKGQETKTLVVKKEKPSQVMVKTKAKTLPEKNSSLCIPTKDTSKKKCKVTVENDQHVKPITSDKGNLNQSSSSVLNKVANQEGPTKAKNEILTEMSKPETTSEQSKPDFDQLSIEDEDSEFEEGEETEPAVKSKVGLNRIRKESLGGKQRRSWEKQRAYSKSPERHSSAHLHHSQRSLHGRAKDLRFRSRSRERYHDNRSTSWSRERTSRETNRQSYRRRSRSRDRKENRFASSVSRQRENHHRRSRSRSRNTDHRTGSDSNFNLKGEANRKNNLQRRDSNVKNGHRDKKEASESSVASRLTSRELKGATNQDRKTSGITYEQSTPSIKVLVTSSNKVKEVASGTSKPSVQTKQMSDLRTRLKKDQSQKAEVEEETGARERELDERIQKIKQRNSAIMKRAKEIQADKMKYSH